MSHRVFFIVGSSAAGKSTVDRNLRLRLTGKFHKGSYQPVPSMDLCFVGRVLFENGKKVLRLSGGDATKFEKLEAAVENLVDQKTLIFEKAHIPFWLPKKLIDAGHEVTAFHLLVDQKEAQRRLQKLNHPSADKLDTFPAYRPGHEDYQKNRDAKWAEIGAQVIYVDGPLRDRCKFIEDTIGVRARYDHVLLDFTEPVQVIYRKFHDGWDAPRP